MVPKLTSPRRQLSRWTGWFFFLNTILMLLVGASYVSALPSFAQIPMLNFYGEFLGVSFAVLAFIGQSALFAFFVGLFAWLLTLCVPKRWFAMLVSILLASVAILLFVVDAIIYHLYHYHLAGLVWNILISGAFSQVIILSPMEWLIFALITVSIVALETLLAYWLWWRMQSKPPKRCGRLVSLSLVACLFMSYTIYLSAGYITTHPKGVSAAKRVNDHLVVMEAQIVPYYIKVLSKLVPGTNFRDLVSMNDGFFVQNSQKSQPLQYPLTRLKTTPVKKPYNIVIIGIDTWRHDMMNSVVTPNIAAFAKQSINFTDNYSGGNSTQPGIFSLFYSLPPTYWSAMLHQHRGPAFIQQLLKQHYQMGIFASAALNYPAFDKTVFRNVPNLHVYTPGNDPAERDKKITQEFKQFITHRNLKKPFFSFLFYDAVHGYCETGTTFPKPFQPAIGECNRVALTNDTNPLPYLNRYKNAVLYDDSLIGQVLHTIRSQGLLKHTIVIITADHGEEFNDEHLDYWGHASAFDPYQVRTPLIVYWPGMKPATHHYQTSHYDIVPTLMKKVLGVTTSTSAYSVGRSLFSNKKPPFLVVGSYINYAVLQPKRTTVIYPGGDFDITYPNGHDLPKAKLNPQLMKQTYRMMNRYYQ